MRVGMIILGVLIVFAVGGTVMSLLLVRSADVSSINGVDPQVADGESPFDGGAPGEVSPGSSAGGDAASLPATTPSRLEEILKEFDRIWAAPAGLQGSDRTKALKARMGLVDRKVHQITRLGPAVVGEIEKYIWSASNGYPRKMVLSRALSALGTDEALRLLADVSVARGELRLRKFAFKMLLGSRSDKMVEVARETVLKLSDPAFILAVLTAGWDEGEAEGAYRAWIGKVSPLARTKSYSQIGRLKAGWIMAFLKGVSRSENAAVQERAGAIGALSGRREEGLLQFFRDLLWAEREYVLIRAIVAAIRRVGGAEARAILEEYSEGGAPHDLAEFVRAQARAPVPEPIRLGGDGEGGGPRMGATRLDTDRMRRERDGR
ncbi:MAG: hypothetical protein O7H41_10460 [Planctomycetota bacterium]|nr:hypothetical protein [Planctomycetota bacterium]